VVADTVHALKDAPIVPSLAVIIPARNEASRLGACLESIHRALAKAQVAAEVMVIDDDSTDATTQVGLAGGATVLHQRPRRGPLSAWKLGVEATSAPLLILVDADCRVDRTALSALLAGFEDAKVGVVAGRTQPVDAGAPSGVVGRSAIFSALLLHQIKTRLGDHDFLPIGRLMAVRRTAWKIVDCDLVPCDRAVAHLARTAGWKIVYAPEALVFFEPVTTYRALRDDYRRTSAVGDSLALAYDRIPRGVQARAVWDATLAAPVDALAWAACRALLLGQQWIRPGQPALCSWPG
jgi:glycosyltransferase involved in cell wall biosynthesis